MHRLGLLLFLWCAPILSAERAGVEVPDTASVGGTTLHLNGTGLREYLWLDIYVGAMYLQKPTRSAEQAIETDTPKRMVMHFIYKHVKREKLLETFQEGLERNPRAQEMGPRIQQLYDMMQDVHAGDEVVIDYVPGTGTTVTVAGRTHPPIPGADFMQAVWSLFIGPNPPSEQLKAGLLQGA